MTNLLRWIWPKRSRQAQAFLDRCQEMGISVPPYSIPSAHAPPVEITPEMEEFAKAVVTEMGNDLNATIHMAGSGAKDDPLVIRVEHSRGPDSIPGSS